MQVIPAVVAGIHDLGVRLLRQHLGEVDYAVEGAAGHDPMVDVLAFCLAPRGPIPRPAKRGQGRAEDPQPGRAGLGNDLRVARDDLSGGDITVRRVEAALASD